MRERALAWAGPFSEWTEKSLFGVRYVIPFAALLLGLMGVVYMHAGTVPSDIADIDAALAGLRGHATVRFAEPIGEPRSAEP